MRITTIATIISYNVKIWINGLFGNKFNILPYKVLFNLTNNCNSKCISCDIWQVKDFEDEMNINDISKFFDSIGPSLIWLALSGGEVTLVKYVESMIIEARKKCKNLKIISFTTNALLPRKVIWLAEKIIENGFDLIVTISLDGDKEIHDRVRGVPGNYEKCVALFDDLKKIGVNVNYGITVSDQNNSFIHNEYRKMRHSIKAVTFVHDDGIYLKENKTDNELMLDSMRHIAKHYSIDSISEIIEYIHIKISTYFLAQKKKSNILPCEVLNTTIHVMPDGGVHPCMFLNKIGNIKDDEISDIVFSKEALHIREQIKNDKCPHCWMNCYSPYSIMQHPLKSMAYLLKSSA
jgi:MoaA/NifB/PqqE/SkfB family radical SAM enzyme